MFWFVGCQLYNTQSFPFLNSLPVYENVFILHQGLSQIGYEVIFVLNTHTQTDQRI